MTGSEIVALLVLMISAIGIVFSVIFQVSPFRWFKGELTNKEFEALMDLMAEDKTLNYDGYRIRGAGYQCWVCTGYGTFEINDTNKFTPWQIFRFFKRFNYLIDAHNNEKNKYKKETLHSSLHMGKIANKVFQKELESKLKDTDNS